MKKILTTLLSCSLVVGCANRTMETSNQSDEIHVDESVRLEDDFYDYVNADLINNGVIPQGKSATGPLYSLDDKVETILTKDFEDMLNGDKNITDEMKTPIQFFEMAMDYQILDEQGVEPLKPMIERIESLKDFNAFKDQWLDLMMSGYVLPFL